MIIHRAQVFPVISSCTQNADYYLFEYMNRLAEHWQRFSDRNNMINAQPHTQGFTWEIMFRPR
jgi:hypothetical protein